MTLPVPSIRRLASIAPEQIAQLADLTIDCVERGASIGFMLPLTRARAEDFWRRVAKGVEQGRRLILVAEDEHGICGTVQLMLDLADNQPHRADLVKLQVHSRARRRGLGSALVREVERHAVLEAKTLLVLDAVTDGEAARLYQKLGWVRVGDIPNFALYPDGKPCGTTFFYRELGVGAGCPHAGV